MRLEIDHVTTYRYDQPVRGVVQSHRLTPSVCAGQRVEGWVVTVSDGQRGGSFRDGAGDWIEAWTVTGPVSEIVVSVKGVVETTDTAGVLRGHREAAPPLVWLHETPATWADEGLVALARSVTAPDALALAHGLAEAVAGAIAWVPGATEAQTTAAEALALGQGVCQDHAHAMIAVAREHGLPARYVSGYLLSGPEGVAHEAAHAWAEVWIEGLGWVGFDAANSCCPDARYVRLGSGFDAQDAAPIKGTTRGQGSESLDVRVAVQAAPQGQSQSQTQQQ